MQPFGQPQIVQNRGYGGYNAYSHPGYAAQQYPAPAQYSQGGYYPQYSQGTYNPALFQGFQGPVPGQVNRGRALYSGGRGVAACYGRGAYNTGAAGDRGRGGFGFRARRKKPFVGGSLETQRQWERQTICCFYLQGSCKFVDACRFLHEDDGKRPCQYGAQCRVGHAPRAKESNGTADEEHLASHTGGDLQDSAEHQPQTAADSA
ncbi:uncharacterized protein TM35_000035210 [Trypanosoma theileri]|uniref:C3H1-type domain-containing protein n=1 Tax=Trypanosoma theileri TaxID=67003 RepID=A0A1X0P7C1_9TRYP|nr:uncharacterized protein TM35_000035210 [Trypanosoma theileri]ORC92768.1 hypothetical protein TM35_000035210 [Trypanosoma theileri]